MVEQLAAPCPRGAEGDAPFLQVTPQRPVRECPRFRIDGDDGCPAFLPDRLPDGILRKGRDEIPVDLRYDVHGFVPPAVRQDADQVEDTASLAETEIVPRVLVRVDMEGRFFLVTERGQEHVLLPVGGVLAVVPHDILYRGFQQYPLLALCIRCHSLICQII